jgi:hypothetical protein
VQAKPKEEKIQVKPEEEKFQAKPKEEKIQAKPKEEKVQTKPKEEKLQAKPKEEKIQGKAKKELRQRRVADGSSSPRPEAATSSASGLPPQLKSGVESLSGMSMDHVQVHYNSDKPAQLNALAYAQGSDIHVGPGQEQHLPHEAWHVVQQAQGRVQATKQLKDGVAINDDKGLEHEADVKGRQAMQAAGRRSSTGDSVRAALAPAALQRRGVVQGVFTGYAGGGWALDAKVLPGNLDVFPGGGKNLAGGGQQGGATDRDINLASSNAYAAPMALGGFNHFTVLYGPPILYQPGGKAKRYTHMHVINGKTHGPGSADNLTLGSTADNNHHRAQVEEPIRKGLPGANVAPAYYNAITKTPPDFYDGNKVAYWQKAPPVPVPGTDLAAPGSTVTVKGVKKAYAYSGNPNTAALIRNRRWVWYKVDPNYGAALSPTILANMAKMYQRIHALQTDILRKTVVVKIMKKAAKATALGHLANADFAMNANVTAGNLAGGVAGTLTAGNNAAYVHVTNAIPAPKAGLYKNTMAQEHTNMTNFAAWALVAFPGSLTCDADLYRPSFNDVSPWYKRSEPQTTIPINQN